MSTLTMHDGRGCIIYVDSTIASLEVAEHAVREVNRILDDALSSVSFTLFTFSESSTKNCTEDGTLQLGQVLFCFTLLDYLTKAISPTYDVHNNIMDMLVWQEKVERFKAGERIVKNRGGFGSGKKREYVFYDKVEEIEAEAEMAKENVRERYAVWESVCKALGIKHPELMHAVFDTNKTACEKAMQRAAERRLTQPKGRGVKIRANS